MRRLLLLATVSAAALFVPSSAASACGGHTSVGSGDAGTVYLVDDGGGVDWIYLESNNIHDLQRGGGGYQLNQLSDNDQCRDGDSPDTVLY